MFADTDGGNIIKMLSLSGKFADKASNLRGQTISPSRAALRTQ